MATDPRELKVDDLAVILQNDPGALDPTDPRCVPGLHGSGPEDVTSSLGRSIRRASGSHLYYFSGQRGTGKSTELRRLAVELNGQPKTKAFIVDVLDYIGESHPIQTVDLLLVTALAFADRLGQADAFHADLLKESVMERLGQWLLTEVEISGITVGGVKGEFKNRQQSILQRLRDFDLGRVERVMADCREFIRQMAEMVRQRWLVDKVVLLVDSLERLRGVGDVAQADMFARVVSVFDADREQLRLPELQVVYAVPPYLPYLTNVRQYVSLSTLASVRVCEEPAKGRRQPRPSGLDVMRRVLDRRYPDWQELIAPAALDLLALRSGGDVRQLLRRFLLDALDQCYFALDRLPLQPDDPIIGIVLDKHRVEFESMVTQDEYGLLRGIGERNAVDLPERKDWPTVARFFDIRAVLNYRNGVEWLDLNPLLWPLIDRVGFTPAAHEAATGESTEASSSH